jgi:DNA ligase (NAD+)
MDTQKIIKEIISDNNKIFQLSIDTLSLIIKEANEKYYYSEYHILDDDLYDLLVYRLESLDKNNKLLNTVSSNNEENKTLLPYFLGSQDKIKFSKETNKLDRWLKKYKGSYILSDKLDGISALLVIDKSENKLLTRGDGKYGRDISIILPYINIMRNKNISDIKETLYIRGELVISRKNFEKYKSFASHSRNFVSGLQNCKEIDTEKMKDIDFVCYEVLNNNYLPHNNLQFLNELGFNVVSNTLENSINLEILNKYYQSRRENSIYDIDGIVVRDNKYYKLNDGIKSKNPKYSFAFKMVIDNQVGESEVVNIDWNVSKDGYLIPKMQIKPLNLAGAIITYVSCHHADYVVKNNLNIGSKVKIIRSGDVIPYVLDVTKQSKSPLLPSNYHYKWNDSKVDFILVNKNIKEYNDKLILNFFSVLKIRDLGDSIVKKIIDSGKDNIKDIINITVNDLLKIEGFKDTLANKIYKNLHNRIDKLDVLTLMVASNCFGRGIGIKKLKIFLELYPNFINENVDDIKISTGLYEIDGFSTKTIEKIIKGINEFKNFYNNEIPEYVKNKFINNVFEKKEVNVKYSFLENKNIVLTGTREIEELLKENSVNIQSNVNNKTDFVICKDKDSNSSKLKKAKDLDIKILDLKDFNILIKS